MDRQLNRRAIGVLTLTLAVFGCQDRTPVEKLPSASETLAAAGKRLSHSHSVHELTDLARDGNRVLASLTRPERDALGRNYLRFRIARSAVVEVAAPVGSIPFWLNDQGFVP